MEEKKGRAPVSFWPFGWLGLSFYGYENGVGSGMGVAWHGESGKAVQDDGEREFIYSFWNGGH